MFSLRPLSRLRPLAAAAAAGTIAFGAFASTSAVQCAVPEAPPRPKQLESGPVNDEDEKCGFCRYMKGGPCRQVFLVWEKCVMESKEDGSDFVDRCRRPTLSLRECTDANYEYYWEFGEDSPGARVKMPSTSKGTAATKTKKRKAKKKQKKPAEEQEATEVAEAAAPVSS